VSLIFQASPTRETRHGSTNIPGDHPITLLSSSMTSNQNKLECLYDEKYFSLA
jgi:hypothetical protein